MSSPRPRPTQDSVIDQKILYEGDDKFEEYLTECNKKRAVSLQSPEDEERDNIDYKALWLKMLQPKVPTGEISYGKDGKASQLEILQSNVNVDYGGEEVQETLMGEVEITKDESSIATTNYKVFK